MTPETWNALLAFIDRYGLPIGMLIAFGWAILKEKFVTGARYQAMVALFERERTDRIAAETIVAKFATANAEVAEAVADLSATVLKRLDERPHAR